jgi:hypothetical protein
VVVVDQVEIYIIFKVVEVEELEVIELLVMDRLHYKVVH